MVRDKKEEKNIHILRPLYVPVSNAIRRTFGTRGYVFAICKFLRRLPEMYFRNYINSYRSPYGYKSIDEERHKVINMQVHVLGDNNKGKVIMLLENQSHHAGFCAIWVYILNRLSFSDKMGFYHVIDWEESEFYQEDHPIHGSTSIFEYYFEQPSGISLADARKSNFVVYDWNSPEYGYNDAFHVGDNNDYRFTDKDVEQFAKIQRKYIHLHKEIELSIKDQVEKLFQGKTNVIGVHARGADTKIGYEDVIRSTSTIMNCFIEEKRENHHYLLGLEIIRDVYTLAACRGFVCGMSYVGFIVQIIKKANEECFDDFIRISKGINMDGLDLNKSTVRKKIGNDWKKELKQKGRI